MIPRDEMRFNGYYTPNEGGYEQRMRRVEQRVAQRVQMRTAGNRFEVDMSKKPAHMTYNWKAQTILGQENSEHMINVEANGWTPVPAERHREMSGLRASPDAEIVRGGMVLMEAPTEFVEDARELDGFQARHQVASQLQRLGLTGHRQAGTGMKREYDRPTDDLVLPDQ